MVVAQMEIVLSLIPVEEEPSFSLASLAETLRYVVDEIKISNEMTKQVENGEEIRLSDRQRRIISASNKDEIEPIVKELNKQQLEIFVADRYSVSPVQLNVYDGVPPAGRAKI